LIGFDVGSNSKSFGLPQTHLCRVYISLQALQLSAPAGAIYTGLDTTLIIEINNVLHFRVDLCKK